MRWQHSDLQVRLVCLWTYRPNTDSSHQVSVYLQAFLRFPSAARLMKWIPPHCRLVLPFLCAQPHGAVREEISFASRTTARNPPTLIQKAVRGAKCSGRIRAGGSDPWQLLSNFRKMYRGLKPKSTSARISIWFSEP